jgi:hypothetical protein
VFTSEQGRLLVHEVRNDAEQQQAAVALYPRTIGWWLCFVVFGLKNNKRSLGFRPGSLGVCFQEFARAGDQNAAGFWSPFAESCHERRRTHGPRFLFAFGQSHSKVFFWKRKVERSEARHSRPLLFQLCRVQSHLGVDSSGQRASRSCSAVRKRRFYCSFFSSDVFGKRKAVWSVRGSC